MNKLHLIIAVCICILAASFCTKSVNYATTWAGTAANQMVTRAALNDAVTNNIFTAKQSFPSDLKMVTRQMAQQYVNITDIAGYDMNRLVPKSTFVSAVEYYSHSIKQNSVCYEASGGYTNSTDAFNSTSTNSSMYTLYSRSPQVGDEIFRWFLGYTYPGLFGACYSITPPYTNFVAGYWFRSNELNAAFRITATETERQYILEIVYPSGTTNNPICLEISYSGSNSVIVRAKATTSVSTTVTVYWSYDIDGTSGIGNTLTIASGSIYSNSETINKGSAIESFDASINNFSPTSNGTQNYVSAGICN